MSTPEDRSSPVPVSDSRTSRNPVRRAAVEMFQDHVTQGDMTEALGVLLVPGSVDPDYLLEVNMYMAYHSATDTHRPVPGAPNPVEVTREMLRMNEPAVWEHALRKATHRNTDVSAVVAGLFPGEIGDVSAMGARGISKANIRLIGRTLMAYSYATVYGQPGYAGTVIDFSDENGADGSYFAGLAASRLFPRPAHSGEQAVDRLRYLFQGETSDPGEVPAIQIAKDAGAFVTSGQKGTFTCPAARLTGFLFRGYGDLLANPAYTQPLQQRIVYPLSR